MQIGHFYDILLQIKPLLTNDPYNFHYQAPNILTSLTLTMRVLEEQRHSNRNHYVTALCSDPLVYLRVMEREGGKGGRYESTISQSWCTGYHSIESGGDTVSAVPHALLTALNNN